MKDQNRRLFEGHSKYYELEEEVKKLRDENHKLSRQFGKCETGIVTIYNYLNLQLN